MPTPIPPSGPVCLLRQRYTIVRRNAGRVTLFAGFGCDPARALAAAMDEAAAMVCDGKAAEVPEDQPGPQELDVLRRHALRALPGAWEIHDGVHGSAPGADRAIHHDPRRTRARR